MTLPEFKSWLDGFSEGMGETPTPEQWAKIKGKLAEVQLVTLPAATFPHLNVGPAWATGWTPIQPVTCSNATSMDLSRFESLLPGSGSN